MATQKKIVLTAEDRTKGAFRGVKRNLNGLETATAGLQKAFAVLAGATGLALVTRSFINAADRATQLENKLKLVTNSSRDLTRVYGQLFKLSKDTRVSFEATAELYARLARSSDHLGLSEEQLLQITESLNQAFAVSGAGIMETASAVRQLGQGLASGTLRGDELRSVMENTPRVARMIAEGMGKTIGELRQLGAEGKLNAESVTRAILKMGPEVQEEFDKTKGTVSQATQAMSDSFMNFVNVVDEETGTTGRLARGLNRFSEAIDHMSRRISGEDPFMLFGMTTKELQEELDATGEAFERFHKQTKSVQESMGGDATGIHLFEKMMAIRAKLAEPINFESDTVEKATKNQMMMLEALDESGLSLEAYNEDLKNLNTGYEGLAPFIEAGTEAFGRQMDEIEKLKTATKGLQNKEFMGFGFKDPNTEMEALRNTLTERRQLINDAYSEELISHQMMLTLKERAERDFVLRQDQLYAQSASNYTGQLASMASATRDMSVEAFELSKALSMAQAVINAYLTYTKVLADPLIPTPVAHGIGVTMMGLSLAYASKISSMNYPKRQYGGMVAKGQTYLVGERGPELFTANQTGNITPNHEMGGTTNVNFSINTVDARNFDSLLQARRGVIIGMINQAMNRSGRAGIV